MAFDLSMFFNLAIEDGVIESKSLVVPIYKKKDPDDPTNYRKIVLQNSNIKIYEEILRHRLYKEENVERLYGDFQYGFRTGRSAVTLALHVEQLIKSSPKLIFMFYDIKDAFDSVDRNCLMSRLEQLGLQKYIRPIATLFNGQKCKVQNKTSYQKVTRGVQQGSPLSPMLFNLYISDLQDYVSGEIYAYADDILIIAEDENHAQEIDNQINVYANIKGLSLNYNPDKSTFMTSSRNVNVQNMVGTDKYTYLGNKLHMLKYNIQKRANLNSVLAVLKLRLLKLKRYINSNPGLSQVKLKKIILSIVRGSIYNIIIAEQEKTSDPYYKSGPFSKIETC